jgi:hypothetical protein
MRNKQLLISSLIIAGSFVVSGFIFAAGASAQTAGIKYPVAELGGCANEADCRAYCNKQENILNCVAFGEKNGMISAEDAARAREFSDVLQGGGPGSCNSKDTCETYCNDTSHLDECLGFAEKHNLITGEDLAQAKKVLNALKGGAQLPGGCKDKDSCNTYCAAAGHSTECLDFAEKAGFLSADELAMAKKVLPLIESGQSPGGCKTKDECESYCSNDTNLTECASFAEKAGLMTKEDAEMVKKVGGKGPGGCMSKETCDTYCNDSKNTDVCFQFAQKYDLIPADKLQEMKDGMARLKAGLSQMPPEMVSCLNDKFGEDVVTKIEAGTFVPGPAAGDAIKGCVTEFMPQLVGQLKAGLKQMPPEAQQCLSDALGADTVAKIKAGEKVDLGPDTGPKIQKCMANMGESIQAMIDKQLEQAPADIRDCIKSKLNIPDIIAKAKSGEIKGPQDVKGLTEAITQCAMNYKPQGVPPANYKPSQAGGSEGGGAVPPSGDQMCAGFKMVPSCDYVPENVRDICKKCKQ